MPTNFLVGGPKTQKTSVLGVLAPFRFCSCHPFGPKTPASCRTRKSDSPSPWPRKSVITDFFELNQMVVRAPQITCGWDPWPRGAEPLPGSVVLLGIKRHAGGPAYKKKRDLLLLSEAPAFPREVRGPNSLDFVKKIGLVRPEIALDRAARG